MPDNASDFSTTQPGFEYRSAAQHGAAAVIGSVLLAAIGFWVARMGSFYCLPLFGIAIGGFIYGAYFLLDNSIKLRIDESGIQSKRLTINCSIEWHQIRSASCLQVTQGANVRHYLKLQLHDHSEHKIEISRLDQPAQTILENFYSFYESSLAVECRGVSFHKMQRKN